MSIYILDKTITFGQYKGSTWGQVLQHNISYVRWAAMNADCVSDEDAEALLEALEETDPGDHDYDDWGYTPFEEMFGDR